MKGRARNDRLPHRLHGFMMREHRSGVSRSAEMKIIGRLTNSRSVPHQPTLTCESEEGEKFASSTICKQSITIKSPAFSKKPSFHRRMVIPHDVTLMQWYVSRISLFVSSRADATLPTLRNFMLRGWCSVTQICFYNTQTLSWWPIQHFTTWHAIGQKLYKSPLYMNSFSQRLGWLMGSTTAFAWNNRNSSCVCWHFTFRLYSSCFCPNMAIRWRWLPYKVPTSTSGAVWASVSSACRPRESNQWPSFAWWCFYFNQCRFLALPAPAAQEKTIVWVVNRSGDATHQICALH